LANGGSIFLASRQESDGRALDPPNWVAVHDHGSNTTQVVRVTLPQGPADFLNFTATHSLQTYQIPNDVAGVSGVAYPASTDDTQTQDDLFASVQYRHAIGDHGTLSFGPSFKSSHLRDTPDYANDVLGANPQAPLVLPNSGTPATCANADLPALAAEGVPTGGLNDCALSIYADRTAIDIGWITQYELRSLHHDVKSGMTYDTTRVLKNYDVAFQPNNYFSPDRFDVYDHATNVGHTEAVYLQDSWRMSSLWTLDAGLREDAFQLRSAQFSVAEAMLSPRLKLTRTFSPRVSVYGYYGRFFTPYSFENVAPGAAACINPNVSATGGGPALTAVQCTGGSPNATGSGFDLKAQRDSDYEIGGSIGIGSTGRLGLRAMQKNATHSIDDVQVGLTNLHQDINYAVGRITVYAAAYQQSLSNHGRFSLNLSRTRAEAKDCETQLLAACVGQAPGFIPDDHDQTWDGTASLIRNDARGGWYSLDAEYGSGLSTAPSDNTVNTTYQAPVLNPYCPAPVGGVGNDNCKVPPHLTFDGEKGFQLQPGLTLAAGMTNLFNDRYWITYLNAQGFHTAQGRTVYVKLSLTK
jgi:hypothetical protein